MSKKLLSFLLWIASLIIVLAVSAIVSLSIGPSRIPGSRLFYYLFNSHQSIEHSILMDIRLPRILLGFAIGGSLSLAGAVLQGMFRNPLVEPYTLGISGGAALGVCTNILFKTAGVFGLAMYPLSGIAGSIAVIVIVYFLSLRRGIIKIQGLLLTGVMISFICSSLIMFIMSTAKQQDMNSIIYWTMGSLSSTSWPLIITAIVISLCGLAASYFFSIDLNAFTLGEEEALHIGRNVENTKKALFFIVSALVGMSVSIGGIIGFVGMVVPIP